MESLCLNFKKKQRKKYLEKICVLKKNLKNILLQTVALAPKVTVDKCVPNCRPQNSEIFKSPFVGWPAVLTPAVFLEAPGIITQS